MYTKRRLTKVVITFNLLWQFSFLLVYQLSAFSKVMANLNSKESLSFLYALCIFVRLPFKMPHEIMNSFPSSILTTMLAVKCYKMLFIPVLLVLTRTVKLWNVTSGECIKTLVGQNSPVFSVQVCCRYNYVFHILHNVRCPDGGRPLNI